MAIRPNLLFFSSFNATTQQNVGIGYRYIKWRITKIKNNFDGVVQAGDLVLLKTGTTLQYNQNAVATSPDSQYATPTEQVENIIDNNPITKWCNINWGNSQTGESIIYIDNKTKIDFDCYYYNTANDAEYRDPISWTLEVSNDNTNWTIVDTVNDATITDNRESQTQIFCTILQPTPTPTPTPSPTPVQSIFKIDVNNPVSYVGTGTTINDLRNSATTTIYDNPSYSTDNCVSYLNFDGVSSYGFIDGLQPNIINNNISVFMWVYPTSNGVILNELSDGINGYWHTSVIEMVGGQFYFGSWAGLFTANVSYTGSTPFNNWYYIGYTFDGSNNFKAYVNGQLIGTTSFIRSNPPVLQFGLGLADITNMGDGNKASFRFGTLEVWNISLTSNEILSNYNLSSSTYLCPTPTPTPTVTPTPSPTPVPTNYWNLSNCSAGINIVVDFGGFTPTENKIYNLTFTNYIPINNYNCWTVLSSSLDSPYTILSSVNSGPHDDCISCPL